MSCLSCVQEVLRLLKRTQYTGPFIARLDVFCIFAGKFSGDGDGNGNVVLTLPGACYGLLACLLPSGVVVSCCVRLKRRMAGPTRAWHVNKTAPFWFVGDLAVCPSRNTTTYMYICMYTTSFHSPFPSHHSHSNSQPPSPPPPTG